MKQLTMPYQHARCGMPLISTLSIISNPLYGREVRS
jgi:hypothetical protein